MYLKVLDKLLISFFFQLLVELTLQPSLILIVRLFLQVFRQLALNDRVDERLVDNLFYQPCLFPCFYNALHCSSDWINLPLHYKQLQLIAKEVNMTTSLNSAVLALENIFQRLYHIEAATTLLKEIEHREIMDIENTSVNFTMLATEALKSAISGIFDECDEIQEFLVATAGKSFIDLKAEAIKESEANSIFSKS